VERILTKEEISELLSAINSGDIETEPTPPLHDPDDEVRKLDLIQVSLGTDRWKEVNLDLTADTFARNYGISLTNRLQRSVTIKRQGIESIKFDPLLQGLSDNGAMGIIRLDPLLHGGMIVFESTLSYAIIEIMLGSAPGMDPLMLDRPLTTIEINIIKSIMVDVCSELEKSLKSLEELSISLLKVESDPRVVNFVPPETDLMVIRFSAQVDSVEGEMFIAIPYISLEPLREKMKNKGMHADMTSNQGRSWARTIRDEIHTVEIEVTAQLEELSLPIREILDLQAGDIIDLDRKPEDPLKILVEGKCKYRSLPGIHKGKKAVRITSRIIPGE
jgi:flagellar motor switch protein FliM